MKFFCALLMLLCCAGYGNAYGEEARFSLYGVDLSMDYAQILRNGVERGYIVNASTVPKEFSDDVGLLDDPPRCFPPDGTTLATGIHENKIDVVKKNYLPLTTHHLGEYRIDVIRYEINRPSGEGISTLIIFFFTDRNGRQAAAFMELYTRAFQEVLQTLVERYGKYEGHTKSYTTDWLVWRMGDVFAGTYAKPEDTGGVFSAIRIPVMSDFINFVYDEVYARSQQEDAKKAAEEAQRHKDRLGGI